MFKNKIPYLGEPRWTTPGWPASKYTTLWTTKNLNGWNINENKKILK